MLCRIGMVRQETRSDSTWYKYSIMHIALQLSDVLRFDSIVVL